jgi:hypothetical protein
MAKSTKNLSLGPFELIERLLAPTAGAYNDAGSATVAAGGDGLPTLDDQLNYFFYDSSLMPLMVQVRVLKEPRTHTRRNASASEQRGWPGR